ncbi:hypothetical protein KRM28CT15_15200 [Krasilnikovia sp. M28-CT-15]
MLPVLIVQPVGVSRGSRNVGWVDPSGTPYRNTQQVTCARYSQEAAAGADGPQAMKKVWTGAVVAIVIFVGWLTAPMPPVTESPFAEQILAAGDPFALGRAPTAPLVPVNPAALGLSCAPDRAPESRTGRPRLGEAIPSGSGVYTVSSLGTAPRSPGRVWLVARVRVAAELCWERVSLWNFYFDGSDALVYTPTAQRRRGEFSAYNIPDGRYATGLIFFDVPATAVRGGTVGFRELPSYLAEPIRNGGGAWSVPASLPAVQGPDAYPVIR